MALEFYTGTAHNNKPVTSPRHFQVYFIPNKQKQQQQQKQPGYIYRKHTYMTTVTPLKSGAGWPFNSLPLSYCIL